MKNALSTIFIMVAMLALAGCEQFSTSYRRIEHTELRMLNFIYEPADAAPGDTVTLTAVFAGDTDDLDSRIDWYIAFNVIRDIFGTETVVDSTTRLEPIAERFDTLFSPNTRAVAFRIPIPADIVNKSASIPTRWVEMLPTYMQNMIPEEFASITKDEIVDMLENNRELRNHPEIVFLLQYFTVPIRVTAKIRGGRLPHTIRSSQTIRYNRRFAEIPRVPSLEQFLDIIPINRNPVVDSIVLFKVKGKNVTTFDSKSDQAESAVRLDNMDDVIIEVENGYTYFIEAASQSRLDYTTTMFGNRMQEKHYAYWQFALDREETAGIHHSKFMDFEATVGTLWTLIPPTDRRVTKFTFWVTVKDEVMNERLRPEGSTLKELTGRFVYK